jgi:APA family basic amino acid/polyamine antiporter
VIWGLCILNVFSIRLSAGFLRWITWFKFGTLTVMILWALVFGLGSWSHFSPFVAQRSGSLPLGPALGAAAVAAFFSFGGWWDVSKIAGEIRDPVRTLPRAMALGVSAVTAAYILISGVFVYLVPIEAITSDETFVAQAGEVLFGRTGGAVLSAIVAICILGGLAAYCMTAPRVYYAMARDGLFFEQVARVHSRYGTPARAILIQGAIASVLVAWGGFDAIIPYFMFAAVGFLGLTVAGLIVVRRRDPSLAGSRMSMPAVFLILIAVILVLIVLRSPVQALLGTAVVLAGLPAYEIFQRSGRVRAAEST